MALVWIHEALMQAIDSRCDVLLVLLHLSSAFDILDHSVLLHQLCDIRLSQTAPAWFTWYLVGHTNAIKIPKATSTWRLIHHGVPQDLGSWFDAIQHVHSTSQISFNVFRSAITCMRTTFNCTQLNHDDILWKMCTWHNTLAELQPAEWDENRNHCSCSTTVSAPSAMSIINVCGSGISLTSTVRDITVTPESFCELRRATNEAWSTAMQQFHWLPVKGCIEYKLLILVFHALHDRMLTYLTSTDHAL